MTTQQLALLCRMAAAGLPQYTGSESDVALAQQTMAAAHKHLFDMDRTLRAIAEHVRDEQRHQMARMGRVSDDLFVADGGPCVACFDGTLTLRVIDGYAAVRCSRVGCVGWLKLPEGV